MRTMLTFLSAVVVLAAAGFAFAQRDAASKIDGAAYEAPYFYDTSDVYRQSAYEHARVLQGATESGAAIPQNIAKEHTAAVRTNLQAANRHLASLRVATKGKPSATAHFDAIEAHHKKALALCDEIDAAAAKGKGDAATAKGKGDAATVHKQAAAIANELSSAQEKHVRAGEQLRAAK